ncbi:unnamed protein product, partial [Allacma fusca]
EDSLLKKITIQRTNLEWGTVILVIPPGILK